MAKKRFFATKINPTRFSWSQWPFFAILIPFCVFMVLPIVYIFNHAFKPFDELIEYPPRFFVKNPTFDNFIEFFKVSSISDIPVGRYIFNSLVITVVVCFLSIVVAAMTGYALSKLRFKMKDVIFEINNIALMFVGIAVTIPKYIITDAIGLTDTFWVHIIPALAIPVGMFLIKQFIDQIPNDLIEAAKMDGATELKIFWTIILPLIKPAIATVVMLSFQTVWNDAGTSSTYVDNEGLKTFAYYVSTLSSSSNTVAAQGLSAVATLIMFLPNFVMFIILQSNVMNTMAHSGIK
jgi:ABC-type glycerol-3-phosphate transport system permease component